MVGPGPGATQNDLIYSPYFSAKIFNDAQVLLGLMSKILPSRGMPGGWGMGVVMMNLESEDKLLVSQLANIQRLKVRGFARGGP